MNKLNLNGKKFGLLSNSENGEVSKETIFHYKQKGELVTVDYSGGSIKHGKIIAKQLETGDLEMVYNCLTIEGELKSGKACAKVLVNDDQKIQLDLSWEWLNGDQSSGASTYVEIS